MSLSSGSPVAITSTPSVTISGGGGSGATATVNKGTGYLPATNAVISNSGMNYSGVPSVTANGVSASSVIMNMYGILSIYLNSGGSGYTNLGSIVVNITLPSGYSWAVQPNYSVYTSGGVITSINMNLGTWSAIGSSVTPTCSVSISGGGGSGASAYGSLLWQSGSLNSISFPQINGVNSEPTIIISGGGGSNGAAYFNGNQIRWPITGFTVTNGGSLYSSPPSAILNNVSGGYVTTCTVASIIPPYISSATVTNGGSGYTSAPSVSLSGGGGSGATATASVASPLITTYSVTNVTVNSSGSGYSSAPSVSLSGGGGSGASATANMSYSYTPYYPGYTTYSVTSVTVNNQGSKYSSAPTVSFSGGGGSGAAATAVMG